MKRVRELDGLRCIAILMVMACHYRPPFRPRLDLVSYGWVGVDLFFVLSGFLITTNLVSLRGASHPYRVFYWRRFLRIFPPYYLVLLFLLAIHPRATAYFGPRFFVPPLLFLNSVMPAAPIHQLLQVLFHGGSLSGGHLPVEDHLFTEFWIGVGAFWSLSVEELFYLVWAPIVLRCTRAWVVAISLSCILFSPVLRVLGHTPEWPEYYSIFFRSDALMMGSLLALLLIASGRGEADIRYVRTGLNAAGLLSLIGLIGLVLYDGYLARIDARSTLSFAGLGYTLIGILFASIVGLSVVHRDSQACWARALRMRPVVFVGTISYMMYLIHVPVWVAVYRISARIRGGQFIPGLGMGLVAAAATVLLASVSWKFFEKPILRFKDLVSPGQVPRDRQVTVHS